jgi:Flp pilus assembly pilin Flp
LTAGVAGVRYWRAPVHVVVAFGPHVLREEVIFMLSSYIATLVESLRRSERGQGLAEYALILGLIAIVAIISMIYLGSQISDKLDVIGNTV